MRESTLQVCFVLDCTASMGPWIHAAKNKILDLLEDLSINHPTFKIYAAFIGYRDFGEEHYYQDFTLNHDKLHQIVMDIEALGGGDAAEDVAGAYRWVTNLNWHADVRAVFHITDAPNHGYIYHDDQISDSYMDGHPTIDLRNDVATLAQTNVDLTVFRLNSTTDIMYDIMRYYYIRIRRTGFRIVKFAGSGQTPDTAFYQEVATQLQESMSQHDPTD